MSSTRRSQVFETRRPKKEDGGGAKPISKADVANEKRQGEGSGVERKGGSTNQKKSPELSQRPGDEFQ